MACSSCGKVNINTFQTYQQIITPLANTQPCDLTQEDVKKVYDDLLCFQRNVSNINVNKQLGYILSMLNLKQFCKYNLEEIKSILNGYTC